MAFRRFLVWILVGFILSFIESFFVSRILIVVLTIFLALKENEPWWPILFFGLFDDLLLVEPLGKGVFIYLFLALIVKLVMKIFGLGKSVQMKVTGVTS